MRAVRLWPRVPGERLCQVSERARVAARGDAGSHARGRGGEGAVGLAQAVQRVRGRGDLLRRAGRAGAGGGRQSRSRAGPHSNKRTRALQGGARAAHTRGTAQSAAHVGRHPQPRVAREHRPAPHPVGPRRVAQQREAAAKERDGVGREARLHARLVEGSDKLRARARPHARGASGFLFRARAARAAQSAGGARVCLIRQWCARAACGAPW